MPIAADIRADTSADITGVIAADIGADTAVDITGAIVADFGADTAHITGAVAADIGADTAVDITGAIAADFGTDTSVEVTGAIVADFGADTAVDITEATIITMGTGVVGCIVRTSRLLTSRHRHRTIITTATTGEPRTIDYLRCAIRDQHKSTIHYQRHKQLRIYSQFGCIMQVDVWLKLRASRAIVPAVHHRAGAGASTAPALVGLATA